MKEAPSPAKRPGWSHYSGICTSLIRHGGRVAIQVPRVSPFDKHPHGFWQWFTERSSTFERQGNHSI